MYFNTLQRLQRPKSALANFITLAAVNLYLLIFRKGEKLDPTAMNILQQIIELGTESHDAVASVVAMAPGTVTVVEQVIPLFSL